MFQSELIAPVPELLERQATAQGERIAFRDARSAVTYADLEAVTGRLAGHLADLGVQPGESVAIFLPNSVEWVESCLAVVRAGGVAVPISYDATAGEVAYRLADAGCRAVVTTDERVALLDGLRGEVPEAIAPILVERGPERAAETPGGLRFAELAAREPASAPRDPRDIDVPAFILYTSGTTGRAKGVLLTVHGMLWVTAACWAPLAGLARDDTVLSPLPLFHSYALNLSVLSILAVGASEYLMEKYSTGEAVRLLQSGAYSFFPGVPTMFHYFLQATQQQPGLRFPALRVCVSAGAIMPATLNREFEERFGVPLLDGYGITETSTMVTMNPLGAERVPGSCGPALPGLEVRIVDPLSGAEVPAGAEGELIVRGPNVMLGYHDKPAETAAALRDGWYHTGDLAKRDAAGFITITGRLKELIIRGGQNIAPAEIEEVVNLWEEVLDCAVVGMAHEHLGEVPALFVVAQPERAVDVEALLAHCRTYLSAYKVPALVRLVEEIPRTGSGKIIRFRLKETLE
ncbi:Acyl-CoA synthetase (AMP-forming)/AMP-acid ligase II [Tistlia consotensis]|uniref:Acyl-CoA synthetase (AMP-forming)/AMP-acid ligase II n=1 Tax=Tistlia consotensis USBA 355 TaxID=560819 RepID=A0A1Y6CDV7_9PROT|nr:AMP-binding protein [Tistlia consotensis]SMF58648.1 Acyl-CoA synthetase (AMP-forming)/AMP-acid ligase II [Tistlia consotensis USBA 355]SNR63502.1 Acyl-CoA synthetase (AMP-forming)/AMP-acid ligase II [Tistlia consotensis]